MDHKKRDRIERAVGDGLLPFPKGTKTQTGKIHIIVDNSLPDNTWVMNHNGLKWVNYFVNGIGK